MRRFVDSLLRVSYGLAVGMEPRKGNLVLHLQTEDANIDGSFGGFEARQEIVFPGIQNSIQKDDGFRPVIAGIDRFGHQSGMQGRFGAARLLGQARRFLPQNDDYSVFHV